MKCDVPAGFIPHLLALALLAAPLGPAAAAGALPAAAPASAPSTWPPPVLAKTAWPVTGGNIQHNCRSPYAGPERPTLKWHMADFDKHFGIAMRSVTIGREHTLYVAGGMAGMYAIDTQTQKVKWTLRTAGQDTGKGAWKEPWVEDAATVAADGTLYVASENGFLYALAEDGAVRWKFAETYHLHSTPTPYRDGSILVPSEDAYLYCIGPGGRLQWRFQFHARPLGTTTRDSLPTYDAAGTIYFTGNGALWAVSPDGRQVWSDRSGEDKANGPAMGKDGTLYWMTHKNGQLLATTPQGKRRWSARLPNIFERNIALGADDTLYVGSGDGNLYAVSPADGTVKWKFNVGSPRYFGGVKSDALVDARGVIYAYAYDGTLYALYDRGDRAEEKWRFSLGIQDTFYPGVGLALDADGTLYLASSAAQGGTFVLVAIQDKQDAAGKE